MDSILFNLTVANPLEKAFYDKLPEDLEGISKVLIPVGSRLTCTPVPSEDSDYDYLILRFTDSHDFFVSKGFKSETLSEAYSNLPDFQSYRRGAINIIVANTTTFYKRFEKATKIARNLNLQTKPERVCLFQAILYDNHVPADMVGGFDYD